MFCKGTFCIRVCVTTSDATLTVASLVDTSASSNFVNKDFLPPIWGESMETMKLPPLFIANCRVVSVEGVVHLFVRMGDLRICAWFGVV